MPADDVELTERAPTTDDVGIFIPEAEGYLVGSMIVDGVLQLNFAIRDARDASRLAAKIRAVQLRELNYDGPGSADVDLVEFIDINYAQRQYLTPKGCDRILLVGTTMAQKQNPRSQQAIRDRLTRDGLLVVPGARRPG